MDNKVVYKYKNDSGNFKIINNDIRFYANQNSYSEKLILYQFVDTEKDGDTVFARTATEFFDAFEPYKSITFEEAIKLMSDPKYGITRLKYIDHDYPYLDKTASFTYEDITATDWVCCER